MQFPAHASAWFRFFQRTCVAYVCVSLPLQLTLEPGRMISGSMSPTLKGTQAQGDTVVVSKLAYRFRKPHRGELVAFTDDMGVRAIKRVVGLPGEVVSIGYGRVYINGKPLTAPALFRRIHYYNHGAFGKPTNKYRVAEGCYFVLGDDSQDSYDSRYWGALRGERIEGRAMAIVWPLPRARMLDE